MSTKPSLTDRNLRQDLRNFVQGLLKDGFGPAEISFCLAEASAGLGFEVAPDSEIAMAVVLDGFRAACSERSESAQREDEHTDAEHECPANVTLH